MYYIDPHIHMVSRTTDDYETLAKMGCVGMSEPAFWAGFDRSSARGFFDYFRQLTEFEPQRAAPVDDAIKIVPCLCGEARVETVRVLAGRQPLQPVRAVQDLRAGGQHQPGVRLPALLQQLHGPEAGHGPRLRSRRLQLCASCRPPSLRRFSGPKSFQGCSLSPPTSLRRLRIERRRSDLWRLHRLHGGNRCRRPRDRFEYL